MLITCPYNTPRKKDDWNNENNVFEIYHGVPGIGLVETGFDLPFVFSSSKFRSDVNDVSP